MAYQPITETQWRTMHGAPAVTSLLVAKAQRVVSKLHSVFEEPPAFEQSGLRIEMIEDADVMANLHTPLGPARLRFGWGIEEGELAGILHVERLQRDRDGRTLWEPVWGVVIPQDGNPYGGSGPDRLSILFDRQLGDHLHNSVFAVGMSMLYAIAAGRPA